MTAIAMGAVEVVDLARSQSAAIERQYAPLASVATWPWRLKSLLLNSAGALVERYLQKKARRLAQTAIWFRGARAEVEEAADAPRKELDSDDRLRTILDELEADLVSLEREAREIVARFEAADGKRRGQVRDAFRSIANHGADLRSEVRAFKAAVQAHDANHFALQAAVGQGCATCGQIDEAFERLMSQA